VRRIRAVGKTVREDAERGIDPAVIETMRLALLKMQDNILASDDVLV